MINIEVEKKDNENTVGVLRRFSQRVRGSGVLNRVKAARYFTRSASKFTKKKTALKRIAKRERYEELVKEGKVTERSVRGKPQFGKRSS